MITSEAELKTTILHTKQKLRDLGSDPLNLSPEDLHDLCTLNLLLDSANEKLKELQDDQK
jgi:hypothetical protein